MAAIIVNTYSLAYEWISSSIYFYDMRLNNYSSKSSPLSVFPNYHQSLPRNFRSVLLNIVSSPTSLALMDDFGSLLIFNPTPPGYYPSILETTSVPTITFAKTCLPGMYKDQYGIHDCILCPTGTRASVDTTTECMPCAPESLCSLGAVDELPRSVLKNTVQVIAYPKSPESTMFEEILINNMFHIGSGHCLIISPLFWSLVVAGIAILTLILIGVLHFCVLHPGSTRVKKRIQWTFKKIDMIREGELWMGGLASLSLMVLLCFAYAFSNAYLKQYPIETSSDSYFACDRSIRNAKFQTSLYSLAIPGADAEEEMFHILDGQEFTLNVDFINTLINCDVVSLKTLLGTTWSTFRWSTCDNINSTLSLSILLPVEHTSIEITLADVGIISALRIGLSGQKNEKEFYYLRELNSFQSFSKNGSILAHALPLAVSVTKVINVTVPMQGEKSNYTGIYILTYWDDLNNLFLSQDQYVKLTSTKTVLTVVITETPYYVKNVQQPIVRQAQLIFHNILFTVVCFEIFGLIFIMYKLIIEPLYHLIYRIFSSRCKRYQANNQKVNYDHKYMDTISNTESTLEQPIRHKF
ncbi:unnamed protein product [Rotaria socialis]|nr:unnamed protein product [Rotaria socialis]